jgi:hypothetical protein
VNAKELGAQPAMLSLVHEYVMRELNSTRIEGGLTKRELFAAMFGQGMVSGAEIRDTVDDVAKAAVVLADALLEELCKEQP